MAYIVEGTIKKINVDFCNKDNLKIQIEPSENFKFEHFGICKIALAEESVISKTNLSSIDVQLVETDAEFLIKKNSILELMTLKNNGTQIKFFVSTLNSKNEIDKIEIS